MKDERAILRRMEKYYSNYFAWMEDFSIPTTNSLSERSLRGIKSKQKISGQFQNIETMDRYMTIKSYTETARRNGTNEMDALIRLASGNPYTLEEILKQK